MITSNNEEFDEKIKALRSHGGTISDLKRHESKVGFLLPEYTMLGYNYRMTDIQGALGVAQMGKAADLLERRRKKAAIYNELLKKVSWLKLPGTIPGGVHSFQSYVCLYEADKVNISNYENFHLKRNSLMMELEQAGIATRQGTHAVTLQKYYQQKYNITDISYPNATIADKLTIALPLYPSITQEEQEYVVDNLISIYKKLNKGK
jgi:perosamine synthetase